MLVLLVSARVRFDTRTGELTLLKPEPTEPLSWGVDINNPGLVLGYSFVSGGREQIGVWNAKGLFKTYFVEGRGETIPTISNFLVFNDRNVIVITQVSSPAEDQGQSFLVPQPGVRLPLAELVEGLPSSDAPLRSITQENDRGDLLGEGDSGSFLLQRIGGPG